MLNCWTDARNWIEPTNPAQRDYGVCVAEKAGTYLFVRMRRVAGHWFRISPQSDVPLVRGFVRVEDVDSIGVSASVARIRRMRWRLRRWRTEVGGGAVSVEAIAAALPANGIRGRWVTRVGGGGIGGEPVRPLGHVIRHFGRRLLRRLVQHRGTRVEARVRRVRVGTRRRLLLLARRRRVVPLLGLQVGRRVVVRRRVSGMNRFSLVGRRRRVAGGSVAGAAAGRRRRVLVGGRSVERRLPAARRVGG